MSHRTTPLEIEGMPPGIPYIIGNEAAERFSFYGMRSILVVFMVQYLHLMDGSGQAISKNEAVANYHEFAGWVYFTPFLGALLADIFLGKYRTILWLSMVYCLGHAALACMGTSGNSPQWLLVGLVLICIGSGGIKPCVSAHVGDQFGKSNHHLIPGIYHWFYFSINFGAFFSTLLTPWLLHQYGPHWAFGVPGVLMALATFMFWLGRKRFVHIPPSGSRFFKEMFSRDGMVALGKLIPLFTFIAVFWSLYDQTGSSWVLQAEQMDLTFLGVTWLESQIQAVNPVLVLIYIPLFTFFVYPWLDRIFPLTPLRKIGLGLLLMTASFALSTLIQTWIDAGQRPSIGWQVLAFAIITASEIMVSIVGLEFAYTQSPRAMKSLIMSLFLLAVWGGNKFTAAVNHFIAIPSAGEVQVAAATAQLPPDWRTSPRNVTLPGHDGVTGTLDDLVARCRQGRLEALEIPGRSVFLAAAEKIEVASGKALPSNPEGRKLLGEAKDLWGNPLVYQLIDSTHAKISSAGPDRTSQTQWDTGLMIEKVASETVPAGATWLGRRKEELGIAEQPSAAGFERTEFSGGQSKLEGAAYFSFFTWLVFATLLIYVPFACFYRPKGYLHD
jgi:POT family proton-dependent oligopeptide transporter